LESKGEEFECAQAIDRSSLVRHWVRNIANQPVFSFRLPLSEGYFYPDFVAELKDERILVVEYKGAHLLEGAQEKLNIGQLWQEKSNGQGLFLMAVKEDEWGRYVYRQIEEKVSSV
jgi:type III restriction enzyme